MSAGQEVAVSDLGGDLTFTPAADGHGSGYASFTFRVSDGSDESAADYTMTIDVTPVNDAPSAGTVTIDDTAPVVGDELTATAAGIADPDGLPAALLLSWQWYGTPGDGSETEIAGATAATYLVRDADAGAALTAKATYQDSGGFANTLASAPTGAVGRAPVLSVGNASATEGQAVTFTVRLSAASTQAVTVDWAASAESGDTAGSGDFTAANGGLTFTAGETEKTVTVATTGDPLDEENETFTVRLTNATNATLPDPPTATGTIDDDDSAPVLSVTDALATEGQAVTLSFEVRLTAASGREVTVDAATAVEGGDTAVSGTDFTAVTTTLTFTAGETAKTVRVSTTEDTLDEENETFTLRLSNATNATLGTDPTATGTIDDDDSAPGVSVTDASATEGQAVTFTVRLLAASGREVRVDWAASVETGNTAGSGDFTTVSATTLTFTAGETEKTVRVSTTEDTLDEENETFTLRLTNATNATLGTDPTATGTIDDDDGAPVLSVTDASASEGQAVTFTVRLTAASAQRVTVDWATAVEGDDTAVSGTDFTAVTTTLTFTAGETEKTVRVSTTEDTLDEENETFTLRLSNATNATLGTDPTATGTIRDDDDADAAPPPVAPAAEATAGSYTSLEVRWGAPETGGPAVTGYELRYREHLGGAWTEWPHRGTGTEATITGLQVNTAYEVDVRAVYGEVRSAWVRVPGTVRTGAPQAARIRSVTVVRGPGADGVWGAGERVELEVRYNLPVAVEQPEYWENAAGDRHPPGPFVVVTFFDDARPGYGEVLSGALVPYAGRLGDGQAALLLPGRRREAGARGGDGGGTARCCCAARRSARSRAGRRAGVHPHAGVPGQCAGAGGWGRRVDGGRHGAGGCQVHGSGGGCDHPAAELGGSGCG